MDLQLRELIKAKYSPVGKVSVRNSKVAKIEIRKAKQKNEIQAANDTNRYF